MKSLLVLVLTNLVLVGQIYGTSYEEKKISIHLPFKYITNVVTLLN